MNDVMTWTAKALAGEAKAVDIKGLPSTVYTKKK